MEEKRETDNCDKKDGRDNGIHRIMVIFFNDIT
jgi:hypothetical protein